MQLIANEYPIVEMNLQVCCKKRFVVLNTRSISADMCSVCWEQACLSSKTKVIFLAR